MIAFISCLYCILPMLKPYLSLPTLVPEGCSALIVSIVSGESKRIDHYDESSVQR